MSEHKAVAVVSEPQDLMLKPVTTAAGLRKITDDIAGIVDALEDGTDYGRIPGVKEKALLKPGAEKLAIAFGAHFEHDMIDKEIDHDREVSYAKRVKVGWNDALNKPLYKQDYGNSVGLYRYVIKTRLVRADGRVLGEGVGSCSTMESKYVDRPRDCENTVLKMAKKRASVDAALSAFSLSNRFTQDVEDSRVEAVEALTKDKPFNIENPEDVAWFKEQPDVKMLDDMAHAKKIAALLHGRPRADLDVVIKQLGTPKPATDFEVT